jgi:hypothetical protein
MMWLIRRLLGQRPEPKKRIRVCIECGMPIQEHREWCAILKGQNDMAAARASSPSAS